MRSRHDWPSSRASVCRGVARRSFFREMREEGRPSPSSRCDGALDSRLVAARADGCRRAWLVAVVVAPNFGLPLEENVAESRLPGRFVLRGRHHMDEHIRDAGVENTALDPGLPED